MSRETAAARALVRPAPAGELVVIGRDELRQLVEDATETAVRKAAGSAPRALLTRSQLGEAIGVCSKTVARLEAEGLPFLRVGDVHRFRLDAVLAWLEQRSSPTQSNTHPDERCDAP